MNMRLNDIAQILQGALNGSDLLIQGVGIDTRTLKIGDLYIAIRGERFDGHDFIPAAEHAGAAAILVNHPVSSALPQILVKDTRLALGQIAAYWRKQLPVKIAGVTGSNGKTSVKEMIASIFALAGNTLYTQGNLNNDIGVPLTLLRLDQTHRFAVIEMGANHPGEIAYTSAFAGADASVITNVGPAHIEGFGDLDGVASTKAEIIESLAPEGITILNRDDAYYDFWQKKAAERKSVSFGLAQTADVRAENIQSSLNAHGFTTYFDLIAPIGRIGVELKLAGAHNVKNALAAAAVVMQFGIDLNTIKQGLETIQAVTGRMQALVGKKGNIIIDDTYNANPASLEAALNAVKQNQQPLWLVLGAFGELGSASAAIHSEMGTMIKNHSVDKLFATGELARNSVTAFGANAEFFEDQRQLIETLTRSITGKELILVKGSRAQKMEHVVAALVDNFRAS